jgi:hypothetical protein
MFNEAVFTTEIIWCRRIRMMAKLKRGKETAVVSYFKVLSRNSPGTQKSTKTLSPDSH